MTYKLLLDAGNTGVKAALLASDKQLEPLFNVAYAELATQALPEQISSVWLASVSKAENLDMVRDWLTPLLAQAVLNEVHSEAQAFGVRNAYQQPQTLGIDRWLAMLGAYNEVAKPTLIIDAGTAITVDWMTEQGQHLGGWIVPGVELMQQSVLARAPKVFKDDNLQWGRANELGGSTPTALTNGCTNAFVGLVKQALSVTETELDWFDYRILFLGGAMPLLPSEIKRRGELRTELILQGLALYAGAER